MYTYLHDRARSGAQSPVILANMAGMWDLGRGCARGQYPLKIVLGTLRTDSLAPQITQPRDLDAGGSCMMPAMRAAGYAGLVLCTLVLAAAVTGPPTAAAHGSVRRVSSAPAPRLFPAGPFTVTMTVTRFASNPANNTSVNSTVLAVMAINGSAGTAYLRDTTPGTGLSSATWTDAFRNTSVVQVSWPRSTGAARPATRQQPQGGGSLCLRTPLFKNQVQVVADLTLFSKFAGFAGFEGVTTWRGMSVRKYGVGTVALYTANNASNVAVGLWDGKGGVYEFHSWQLGVRMPPQPVTCREVKPELHTTRPQWWLTGASAAGVEAQDAGVSVQHGSEVYWCVAA